MNIKRVVENDTRAAFEKVKALYGEDTVILSNKKLGKQVELMVAIGLDDGTYDLNKELENQSSSVDQSIKSKSQESASVTPATVEWMRAREKAEETFKKIDNKPKSISERESIDKVKALLDKTNEQYQASDDLNELSHLKQTSPIKKLSDEMSILRDMFATHLDITKRNQRESLSIEAKEVLTLLEESEIASNHINHIQTECLTSGRRKDFMKKMSNWLGDNISSAEFDIVENGGVYALIGMAGVGKTTTIAKLASQAAIKHGKDNVALITLDHNRIGSKEQMKLFGMMLGVSVMHASNSDDIKSLLNSLSQKIVVLIDTPGASEISASLKTQAEALKNASGKISVILTLSANSQNSISKKLATSLSESASGVVVTKLDEVENFGGIVSALIDSKIPLLGVSDGQKIPGDYKAISVSGFVNRCFGIIGTEIKVDSEKADLSAA